MNRPAQEPGDVLPLDGRPLISQRVSALERGGCLR